MSGKVQELFYAVASRGKSDICRLRLVFKAGGVTMGNDFWAATASTAASPPPIAADRALAIPLMPFSSPPNFGFILQFQLLILEF